MRKIVPAIWTPENERMVSSGLASAGLADVKRQVQNGASLWALKHGNQTIGAFVLRIDHLAEKNEGVIVAAGGHAEYDITEEVLPAVEKMFVGCQSLRIHTIRMGLAKKLARQNYALSEMILTKVLNG